MHPKPQPGSDREYRRSAFFGLSEQQLKSQCKGPVHGHRIVCILPDTTTASSTARSEATAPRVQQSQSLSLYTCSAGAHRPVAEWTRTWEEYPSGRP